MICKDNVSFVIGLIARSIILVGILCFKVIYIESSEILPWGKFRVP